MSEPLPNPPVDLGNLLKTNPYSFRVHKLFSANMPGFLKLELMVGIVVQHSHERLFTKINCINAVDYALRPKPPNCLEGGDFVRYFEQHERLETIGQDIPHSDGLESFNPPIKFTLLELEDTYVIAERFEMITLQ